MSVAVRYPVLDEAFAIHKVVAPISDEEGPLADIPLDECREFTFDLMHADLHFQELQRQHQRPQW